MRVVEDNLTTAIGELQCVQTGTPATVGELSALRIARNRVEMLVRDCVRELRDHPTDPAPWKEITAALDSDSAHAVRQRFSATFAIELEQVDKFWAEHSERFVWNFLPNGFVYGLYRGWLNQLHPGSTALSQETFARRLLAVVLEAGCWEHTRVRTGSLHFAREPLLDLAKPWRISSLAGRASWGLKRVVATTD